MSPQLSFKLLRRSREQGFTISLAVGLGLLIALVGVTMLVRSSGDRLNTSTERAIASSQSAAELGITRYLNLLNSYRAIASFDACGDSSLATTGTCTDTTNPSWFNPATIPNLSTSAFASITGEAPEDFCDGEASPSPSPSLSPQSVAERVSSMANQQWQDIDPNDSEQGQVRLVNYTYDPATDTGTLIVEGRVRQEGSGESATQATGTAIERLQVTIPVNAAGGPPPPGFPNGLWVNWNPTMLFNNVNILGRITDSTCTEDSNPEFTGLTRISPYQPEPFEYEQTPGRPFPPLPPAGYSPPVGAIVPAAIPLVSPVGRLVVPPGTEATYPRVGDSPVGGRYIYHLSDSYISLNLAGASTLIFDAPGQTIVIYADGHVVLTGASSIRLTPGTKLIIYAHKNIVANGNSQFVNPGTPDMLQIYGYTTNPSAVLTLNGSTDANSMFLFAPNMNLVTGAIGDPVEINGTVWVRSFRLGASIFRERDDINWSNLEVSLPSGGGVTNTIGLPTSWRRVEVP